MALRSVGTSTTYATRTQLADLRADLKGYVNYQIRNRKWPDLITSAKKGGRLFIVSHRGGVRIHPEHTMQGYRDSFNHGFLIECDVRKLASGELVCIHDATTTRTMTGTAATVSAMTVEDWLSRQVKSPWPGGKAAEPVLFGDVLDEFGGRTILVVEVKDDAAAADVINAVTRRGLHRCVIVQSFTLSVAKKAAAAGIASMFLCGATTSVTPTQLREAKIEFLGPSQAMSAVDIATFRAKSIQVVPYTVETPAEWTALQAKSVDGAFFNDPWGATGRYARQNRDPFWTGVPPYGWAYWDNAGGSYQAINYAGQQNALFLDGMRDGASGTKSLRQGWSPTTTGSAGNFARVRFTLAFDRSASSATRWAGVFLGTTPNGDAYKDVATAGQSGYHFLIRRDGELAIYKVQPSLAPALLNSVDSADLVPAGIRFKETEFEIYLTDTGVTLRRLDTGDAATFADAAYRNNLEMHLTVNQTLAQFSNMSVEQVLPATIGA